MALSLTPGQVRLLDQAIKDYLVDLRRANDPHPLVTLRASTAAEFRGIITPYVLAIKASITDAQLALPGTRSQQDTDLTQALAAADALLLIL